MNTQKSPVQVQPDTRNHQGFFIPDDTFYLVEETPSGWAKICSTVFGDGYASCHLVNPEDLKYLR
jgi:hypothetical protein